MHRFRAGDTQGAGRAQEQLTPLHKEIVASYGAVGVKAALDHLGWSGGVPRAPLQPLAAKDLRKVTAALDGAGLSAA